jgi:hypothetical protein
VTDLVCWRAQNEKVRVLEQDVTVLLSQPSGCPGSGVRVQPMWCQPPAPGHLVYCRADCLVQNRDGVDVPGGLAQSTQRQVGTVNHDEPGLGLSAGSEDLCDLEQVKRTLR